MSLMLAMLASPLCTHAQQTADSAAAPGVQRPTVPLTVEERLAKLEAEVEHLRQENQQLRTQAGMGVASSTVGATTSDASDAPNAADAVQAQKNANTAKKIAEAKAAEDTNIVSASPTTSTPPAPKPEPGINVSAITPPQNETSSSAATTTVPSIAKKEDASADIASTAAPAPAIIKPAGSEQLLSVGGFIQSQAEAGDAIDSRFNGIGGTNTQNDRFYIRRARIVLGGNFDNNFDFKIGAEMTGSLSATPTTLRGQLADAYISWTRFSALNLTLGQFKTSYGFEFLSNDLTIYPIEHAFVTDALTLGRQVGAQASGTFLKSRLNYTIGIFNGNGVNTNTNDNNKFMYVGRISFAPVKERIPIIGWSTIWTMGFNTFQSQDSGITLDNLLPTGVTFTGKRSGYGVDTQMLVGPWDIWFEYMTTTFDPNPASISELPLAGTITKRTTAAGWYLQGAYSIVPKKWQAILRYETFNPDISTTGNGTTTWTFGINYLIKGDDLKLMLDYLTSDPRFYFGSKSNESSPRAQRVLLRLQAAF